MWTVYALVVNVGYTSCWFCNLYLLFSRIVFCGGGGGSDDELYLGMCLEWASSTWHGGMC